MPATCGALNHDDITNGRSKVCGCEVASPHRLDLRHALHVQREGASDVCTTRNPLQNDRGSDSVAVSFARARASPRRLQRSGRIKRRVQLAARKPTTDRTLQHDSSTVLGGNRANGVATPNRLHQTRGGVLDSDIFAHSEPANDLLDHDGSSHASAER